VVGIMQEISLIITAIAGLAAIVGAFYAVLNYRSNHYGVNIDYKLGISKRTKQKKITIILTNQGNIPFYIDKKNTFIECITSEGKKQKYILSFYRHNIDRVVEAVNKGDVLEAEINFPKNFFKISKLEINQKGNSKLILLRKHQISNLNYGLKKM
jgi:hypothetical protein